MRKKPALCSECDPSIGVWHGRFARTSAAGLVVDNEGFIWGSVSDAPPHSQILGQISSILT